MTTALLRMFTPQKTKFCNLKEWTEWTMKQRKVKLKEWNQKLKEWTHKIK